MGVLVARYRSIANEGKALADRWWLLLAQRQRLIDYRDEILKDLSDTLVRADSRIRGETRPSECAEETDFSVNPFRCRDYPSGGTNPARKKPTEPTSSREADCPRDSDDGRGRKSLDDLVGADEH